MPGTALNVSARAQFKLDEAEFLDRHEMLVSSLERGKIGFDEYLDRTIFNRPPPFHGGNTGSNPVGDAKPNQ